MLNYFGYISVFFGFISILMNKSYNYKIALYSGMMWSISGLIMLYIYHIKESERISMAMKDIKWQAKPILESISCKLGLHKKGTFKDIENHKEYIACVNCGKMFKERLG